MLAGAAAGGAFTDAGGAAVFGDGDGAGVGAVLAVSTVIAVPLEGCWEW
jgi:hypothetical protein